MRYETIVVFIARDAPRGEKDESPRKILSNLIDNDFY